WYRRHPEIDDVAIVAPLFGLGLPRTGSTALSFLLAQDPNIRYLRQWESSQPCPPPSTVVGPDPRIQRAMGEKAGTRDHVLSVADVYADIAGVFTDHLDRHYLGRLNVEHWSVAMSRALTFRDRGADHRFYDIDFRAMQADPIGEVRGLYAWLGEPVTEEFES